VNFWYETAKKTGVFSLISQYILERFLQSFHHMKALWVQMIDLYLIFRFVKGCCHGNQNNVGRNDKVMNADEYHLHSLALAFDYELEYHYLYVRINISDDQATSDINLVGF